MKTEIETINPADGSQLTTYEMMSDDQMKAAINACHEAFLEWRERPLKERAELIGKIGEALSDAKAELSELMVKEMGKLYSQAEEEIDLCVGICQYTAENGPKELEGEARDIQNGAKGEIEYAPIGVIYGIQPWNFPAYQVIRYSIANLMAGNGVLLKHAESVTGSGLKLQDIYLKAGLPQNLFSVLRITHDQSEKVIEHDLVRGVTLTGSSDAGRKIAEQAGRVLKKTVLELGSNDAYLVLSDADIDLAVETSVQGRIYNNGETCVAAKRFVVVNEVYDEFVSKFVAAMKDLKIGDPMEDGVDIGPMARADLRDTLHDQVQKSVEKGAKVLCGGDVPEKPGFYYPATVLTDVSPGQPAYDDELFGPVASVIRAKNDEDAMRIANDSRFGLGGGIFSRDVEKAKAMAKTHFDTGMVFINGFGLATPSMPFGGVKNSGYGREHGGFGMKEFVNAKSVCVMAA